MDTYTTLAAQLERDVSELFWDVTAQLKRRFVSVQMMRDDNFRHRRDRKESDIHAFYELANGQYLHLRGCVRHMLFVPPAQREGRVYLTGYLKSEIVQVGMDHSFQQRWYDWNAGSIASELINQNPTLLVKRE